MDLNKILNTYNESIHTPFRKVDDKLEDFFYYRLKLNVRHNEIMDSVHTDLYNNLRVELTIQLRNECDKCEGRGVLLNKKV